jgi:choline dehydrogenase-like flavoprotein
VAEIVADVIGGLPPGREVQPMPVAARPTSDGWRYTAADELLRGASEDSLSILSGCVAREILHDGSRVSGARAYPAGGGEAIEVTADVVVIAAGTVGSAQLITASGMDAGPALGAYLGEHTIVGTRVLLKDSLRGAAGADDFPFSVWIPTSSAHGWSSQVQNFPLNLNSTVPEDVPLRDTTDILAFCPITPQPHNRLVFDKDELDGFGLPVATGEVELSVEDVAANADALREVYRLSSALGDLTGGWSMEMPPRGGSMHLMGSCRMGAEADGTSVVSPEGRLWNYDNCYVAGNAVLSERNACNPTLTMIAFALRCADAVRGDVPRSLIRSAAGVDA